jgi:anti-anti-sigma factor
MKIQTSRTDACATLRLSGRFQFDSRRDFRSAYDQFIADAGVKVIVLDFTGVDYLDSSALGMLLLLREKAGAVGKEVELANTRGAVRQVLDVANFARLFRIS